MNRISFFLVLAFAVVLTACSEDDSVVDQGLPETPSALVNLELSGYQFDTDNLNIPDVGEKHPDDPIRIPIEFSVNAVPSEGATVNSVRVRITPRSGNQPVVDETVQNPTNGLFTTTLNMDIVRNAADDYDVLVEATDSRGIELSPAISKIVVLNGKYPPVFSDFNGPDSLKRPTEGNVSFYFTVRVTDASGPEDIRTVFYRRVSGPDGPAPSGSSLALTDDGRNGDAVANDSIYTAGANISSTNLLGEYTFEFQAVDRSNLAATPIIHKIIVY